MARQPRVGVGVVIRRDGELLVQRRAGSHGHGTWSTPGGHLDFGESPAECAVREVAEETGLAVRTLAAPDEASELGWFPSDAPPGPLFPPLRRLLDGDGHLL